jgi:hypothetical protein
MLSENYLSLLSNSHIVFFSPQIPQVGPLARIPTRTQVTWFPHFFWFLFELAMKGRVCLSQFQPITLRAESLPVMQGTKRGISKIISCLRRSWGVTSLRVARKDAFPYRKVNLQHTKVWIWFDCLCFLVFLAFEKGTDSVTYIVTMGMLWLFAESSSVSNGCSVWV